MSWPLVKLTEVAEVNPRCPKDIDEDQIVSFVAMASASEEGVLLGEEPKVLKDTKKGFTYFERGDVLLAKITPCFENGKSLRPYQIKHQVGFGSTEFHVVRADLEKLDPTYLFYLLWSDAFRFLGTNAMAGAAGQKRVGTPFLKQIEIPLPPLEEQKRIAAILDKADAIRQKRKQAIDLADEFLRSVFLDMFGDPVTNPKGWEVKPLRDVVGIVTGNTPSRKEPENYGDEIEWIKSDNINTPSHFLTSAEESLSESGLLKGRAVNSGAVLMTCIAGSLSCIGNIAIADRRVSFNQQINALVPKDSITTEYLYALMLVSKQKIQDSSTNSMKGMLSKGTLGNIEFPIAPERKQMDFVDFFNKYLKMLAQSDFFHNQSNIQFNSLSQKAFSGQL
ncbi:restriction endonuclease subunit S [Vibrio sp. 704]|uniref:restriction endonuclease subunit S n=1 Tax=Vibrio sp. 704 TaxID=3074610 RepID=UPI0029645DF3|nr:restriction endonuclease subunit S [Vibrio sp. 704]MDW2018839.1 restriction endonuclease subunit S [Vibrio sp. 704]